MEAREQLQVAPTEPVVAASAPEAVATSDRFGRVLFWLIRFSAALFLFIGGLQVMKTGAKSFGILDQGGFLVHNAGATLGLGWIGALFVLSGSPIAATALALVGADKIGEIQGFTMLTGSRLGAAFVVLVTAVIYALRGKEGERMAPLSTAVMALSTTALIYIPAAVVGLALLNWDTFHAFNPRFLGDFGNVISFVYDPILARIEAWPPIVLFFGGLGLLLVSFKIVDSVMPKLDDHAIEESKLSWLRKKWPMFGLGCLVALITMSVSVALTILVPLVAKGYAKREDIIPYIMGANITTLGDTMLAAFALHSGAAVRIVIAEVIATSILSVLLLAFFYPQLRSGIWKFQRTIVRSKSRLAAFTVALFLVPLAVIATSNLVA